MNLTPPRILIVEDDPGLGPTLAAHMRAQGWQADMATHGAEALPRLRRVAYDLLLLDLMLPGVGGLEICREARKLSQDGYLSIIMMSAKGVESQRILGLDYGADDYLCKPFSLTELAARARAQLRRASAMRRMQPAQPLTFGELRIDPGSHQVACGEHIVNLTAKEFELLWFFAQHPGKVFSRMALLDQVWGAQHDGFEHTVNSHINRLRNKIEPDPARPSYIQTVWGVGYRFLTPEQA